MEVPKEQEKLHIKRFSNKKRTQGQSQYFYEIRANNDEYLGDIYFLEVNNQWYFHGFGNCFLSATELYEISMFINALLKNKSIY